jgi:Sec-independent protein translocase protein TatA
VSLNNPLLTHEFYAYVLDALPMILAALLLNIVHPGVVLKGPESEFPRLSRKEKRALKQSKKAAKQQRKQDKRLAKQQRKQEKEHSKRARAAGKETYSVPPEVAV